MKNTKNVNLSVVFLMKHNKEHVSNWIKSILTKFIANFKIFGYRKVWVSIDHLLGLTLFYCHLCLSTISSNHLESLLKPKSNLFTKNMDITSPQKLDSSKLKSKQTANRVLETIHRCGIALKGLQESE